MPATSPTSNELPEALSGYCVAFDQLNAAAFILKPRDASIVFANRVACRITGRRKGVLERMSFLDLFDKADQQRTIDMFSAGSEFGRFSAFGVKLERRSKRLLFVDLSGRDLVIGKQRFIVMTAQDVTERKLTMDLLEEKVRARTLALEKALREAQENQKVIDQQRAGLFASAKLASLGEMSGGLAHEINNPLTVVQGVSEALRPEGVGGGAAGMGAEKLGSLLDRLDRSVERISKVVLLMRSFARDHKDDPMQLIPLADVIEGALGLSRQRLANHGIELKVAGIPEDWSLNCRAAQISQVVFNVVHNAFDAVKESTGDRWVKIETESGPLGYRVTVINSGPKIPKPIADRVFEPFFTTKAPGRGAGLGLSSSRTIVEGHGGSISLDLKGKYTTFTIQLPRAAGKRATRPSARRASA